MPSNVLWTVFFHTRQLMALRVPFDDRMCLPLFSSPFRAEVFLLEMGLEQHLVSAPLWPAVLKQLLEYAEDAGFDYITLDPPADMDVPAQMRPIEDLLDQVEAKL
jgi:ABC-type sugar transport system substrate-binding protein